MKSSISLKRYLSLHFVTVASLPVITIACLVWFFMMPALNTRANLQHQAMARSIAGQISAHLGGGERQLVSLAEYLQRLPFPPDMDPNRLLDTQCGDGEFFEALFVVDQAHATIQAVGLPTPRRMNHMDYIGLDLSGRRFIDTQKLPNHPVWSETLLSTVSSRMAVALTVPMAGGFITGEITLDNLSEFIRLLPVDSEFRILVIDRVGRVVADSRKQHWGDALDIDLPAGEMPAESTAFELDGEHMLGSVAAMEAVGWHVLVAQPIRQAFKPLRDTFALIGLGLTMALGLVLAIAWLLAGRLTSLFNAYTERAETIAAGKYDLTWPAARTREYHRLGQSLKRMAEKISQREKSLVESEERLKDLMVNVPGVVYQFTVDPTPPETYDSTILLREKSLEVFGLDSDPVTYFDDFAACLPDEDRFRFTTSIKTAVETFQPWHYEGRFIKPSGAEIWFEGNSTPRRIDGKIVFYGLLTDITRRKGMESRLRLARFIIDNANIGIYRIAPGGNIHEVNRKAAELLGYSKEELESLSIEDVDPLVVRESWAANWRKLMVNGMRSLERQHRRKDGSLMPVEINSNFLEYEGRQYAIAFVQDIAERKRTEASLRLTQFIVDKAPIGIWRMGQDGRVLDVNEQGCYSLGYAREELCQMKVFDFDPNFDSKRWAENLTTLKVAGTSTIESIHQRKSGETFPIQVIRNWMQFGDQEFHVAFVQDITQRKQAEAELRRLRNYLSNIIDSMPSILVAVDGEGRVTQWNRQAMLATGLSFETARRRPLDEVFARLKSEMVRINTSIRERRVINSPKVPHKLEHETRFEDITIFPLVANGVDGAVIRVDDVTQKVRLEEMMIQSEKMLSVGGLAAGMAHEINNPLAGILQNASVLENRLLGDLPTNHRAAEAAGITMDGLRRYLEMRRLPDMVGNIRESGSRAAEIVKNMLSFARKSDRRVSSHDLSVLLDQTLELVRTDYDMKKRYDVKQIHIERVYDPLVPPIPCEASKLQQVFMNILKNGAEAMAEVVDPSEPPAFVLRLQEDGAWVRVEIEDNGPGMDEATRRRIFEPFFTTKPVGTGTGLGLSVSYFIVTEDHGGEMSVHAAEGGGTCFEIRLPKEGR